MNGDSMHFLRKLLVGSMGLMLAGAALAATIDIGGVKVEDSATVSGVKLPLNGAGIRFKGPFKVYVGELYTSKKVTSLDELVSAPGPKRMRLVMTREIEAGPFGKLLTRGMEDNNPKAEVSKLIPGLLKMGALFTEHKSFVAGDVIEMDWIPGTGLVITVKGKVTTEPFKEPEFFKALMAIWLGPQPAYWKLKENLLGDMS